MGAFANRAPLTRRWVPAAVAVPVLASSLCAQGVPFQTPGMPTTTQVPAPSAESGQADRFTAGFNPAFSFIVDGLADFRDFSGGSSGDGVDLELRAFELSAQAWVDPSAWAYFVGATDGESLAIEEAAIHYKGFGGNTTLRAGRFFVDFGKQMQTHVHELRTVERPLVLRAYLGDEVKGDGLQWDAWRPAGDETVMRWSLGVFSDLLPEESAFPSVDSAGAPLEVSIEDRKGIDDLNFTARVSAFTDVGEHGVLQGGASWRAVPEFTIDDTTNGLSRSGLSSHVVGLDLTYGRTDETGEKRWTLGTEVLFHLGDHGAETIDPDGTPGTGDESLRVLDGSDAGFYAFVDYAWDPLHSVGLQFSAAELGNAAGADASEVDVYYTRMLSEYHRVRFQVGGFDSDTDPDSVRVALQYTAFLGAHGHGANW